MAVALEQLNLKTGISQELEIRDGFDLTLTQLVDSFFPDGSPVQKDEMNKLLHLCNELLSSADLTYYLSASNILPFIRKQSVSSGENANRINLFAADPQSQAFNLQMKLLQGSPLTFYIGYKNGHNHFNNLTHTKEAIQESLEKRFAASQLEPEKYGLNPAAVLYRLAGDENLLSVKPLSMSSESKKISPILILEKTASITDSDRIELRIAVETDTETGAVQEYSKLRTLFTIKLKDLVGEATEDLMFSDYYHSCHNPALSPRARVNWIFGEAESYGHISEDTIKILNSPISIYSVSGRMLERHIPYTTDFIKREEMFRYYRPIYYLKLLNLSAELANLAVEKEGKLPEEATYEIPEEPELSVLSEETRGDIEYQFHILDKAYGNEKYINTSVFNIYSPIEFLLYESLWRDQNTWKDLGNFILQLTKAVEKNPHNLWKFMVAIGLKDVFPALKGIQDYQNFENLLLSFYRQSSDGKEAFCRAVDASLPEESRYKRQSSESDIGYWTRLIDLLPDISASRDFRPAKESSQSDIYYMKLCKGLAAFAVLNREEASAAFLVKAGAKSSYAHDRVNKHFIKRFDERAAKIALYELYVDTANQKMAGYTLYTLREPDPATALYIRHFQLARIFCGIPSASSIGSINILSSDSLVQGLNPPPDEIIIGMPEMEEELFNFLWYQLGDRNLPDALVQKYISGEKSVGGYDAETADIYTQQMDALLKEVGSIEQEILLEWLGTELNGKKVLDDGCGSGNEVHLLNNNGADVYGIDGSSKMISQTIEKYPELADRFRENDVSILPFDDETFDIIISKYVINENENIDTIFREIIRCLKPDGTLIFFAHHPMSQMAFSDNPHDYFGRRKVNTKLGEKLTIPEPQHTLGEYLSQYFTDSFILARFQEGQDPSLRMHPDKNYPEMLVIKAIKKKN